MRTVLIYSGGSDSYTLLHFLRSEGHDVLPLTFSYGQRHMKEINYAANECRQLGLPHEIVNVSALNRLAASTLTRSAAHVPEGYYAADNMSQTVVPNRNMIMLALAAAYAISTGSDALSYGAHQGDHDVYPDCRPEFVSIMRDALRLCDTHGPRLIVPFLDLDKRAIYRWGLNNGLDYSRSWTCYNGRDKPCGRCGSCVERLHAFYDIGEVDPVEYEDDKFWIEAVRNAGHTIMGPAS